MNFKKTVFIILIATNIFAIEFDFAETDSSDSHRTVKVMRGDINEHNLSLKDIDKKGLVIKIKEAFHLPNYLLHKDIKDKIVTKLISNEWFDIEFANIKQSKIKVGDTIEIFSDKKVTSHYPHDN